MKKRIIAASLISASLLSACSLGGSSETVIGEFNFSPKILNPDPTGFEVLENQVSAFTVTAIDQNLDPLSLSISGTDADLFIHLGGGVIEFRDAPDHEMPADADTDNRYDMTITVSDGESSDVVDFAVTVLDDVTDNVVVTKTSCENVTSINGLIPEGFKSCAMTIGETDRSFLMYLPKLSIDQDQQTPLLFSLHGNNELAQDNAVYTNFAQIADKSGTLIVFPQASVSYKSAQTEWDRNGDNIFISAISDYMIDNYDIDAGQIYAAGKSEGGAMVFDLACKADNPFSAIGVVGGSMTPSSLINCNANTAMPLVQIHGKLDNLIPIAGSSTYLHLDAVTEFWSKTNKCSSIADVSVISDKDSDADLMGGISAKLGGCELNTSIEVYSLNGLGNEWPNQQSFDIDASAILWQFMSSYDRNGSIQ